jgi:hypothetical protein
MGHDPLCDVLCILAWLWLGMLLCQAWRQGRPLPLQTTPAPAKALNKRAKEPAPCVRCGGSWKRDHGKTVNPSHNRKSGAENPLPTVRAPVLDPTGLGPVNTCYRSRILV